MKIYFTLSFVIFSIMSTNKIGCMLSKPLRELKNREQIEISSPDTIPNYPHAKIEDYVQRLNRKSQQEIEDIIIQGNIVKDATFTPEVVKSSLQCRGVLKNHSDWITTLLCQLDGEELFRLNNPEKK